MAKGEKMSQVSEGIKEQQTIVQLQKNQIFARQHVVDSPFDRIDLMKL